MNAAHEASLDVDVSTDVWQRRTFVSRPLRRASTRGKVDVPPNSVVVRPVVVKPVVVEPLSSESPSVPRSVVGFIRDDIHSVLQLEVLLLLRERGGGWSPTAVAEELRITNDSAELRLRDLHLRSLLRYDPAAHVYAFFPETERLRSLVDELASCYSMMRYTIISLIFSVPGDSARTLAEAFRFRKRNRD